MSQTELHQLSVAELAAQLRAKQVSGLLSKPDDLHT